MTRYFSELPLWDKFNLSLNGRELRMEKISTTQAKDVITGKVHNISPDTIVTVL